MSNVLYQCPVCGDRLFATPGQTGLKMCSRHPEEVYVQQEEFAGADMLFHDGVHIQTGGVEESEGGFASDADGELARLRNEYERITQMRVDKRWGVERLQELINAAKQLDVKSDVQELRQDIEEMRDEMNRATEAEEAAVADNDE